MAHRPFPPLTTDERLATIAVVLVNLLVWGWICRMVFWLLGLPWGWI